VDEYDSDLRTSEELKEGVVPPSDAEWPLRCMEGQKKPNIHLKKSP